MATQLEFEFIVVIVLASILVLLVIVFFAAMLLFIKKRRMFCFSRDVEAKPFLIPDKQMELSYRRNEKRGGLPFSPSKKGAHKYQPLDSSAFLSKRDPFANKILENPMVNEDDLDADWTNPAFDAERAQLFDAAVTIQSWHRMMRFRIPYVQLRESTVICQALYRGRKARRRIPQLKKEKQLRDHHRKKQAGWKKKGTLSALKFYDVKGYGFAEVEQLYGLETIRNAADQLKKLYGGKGKMRLKLFISVKGLKLYDFYTMSHFATVKVSSVSFCTLDPKNKKIFAFINRKKKRNFCHVFQSSEQDAQKMVETMAEAFEVTFKKMEEKRAQREVEKETRVARLQKEAFHRQAQQLEVEVASMMEMAETASMQSHSRLQLIQAEVPPPTRDQESSPHGSQSPLSNSREPLIPLPGRRSRPNTAGERIVSLSREPLIPPGRRSRSNTGGESGVLAPPKESIGQRPRSSTDGESGSLALPGRRSQSNRAGGSGSLSGSGSPLSGSKEPLIPPGRQSRSSTTGSESGLLVTQKAQRGQRTSRQQATEASAVADPRKVDSHIEKDTTSTAQALVQEMGIKQTTSEAKQKHQSLQNRTLIDD